MANFVQNVAANINCTTWLQWKSNWQRWSQL